MPAAVQTINTSAIAKLYRTTTTDIEKRLTALGHAPVRTIIQQSGRRFMVWDKVAVIEALNKWKAQRLEELQAREVQRNELIELQKSVPRTSYDSPDVKAAASAPVSAEVVQKLLDEMQALKEQMEALQAKQKNPQEP